MSLTPAVDMHKNVASWPGVMLCLVLSELCTLHIVVGEKRQLLGRNNQWIVLNSRPFLAEWKTFLILITFREHSRNSAPHSVGYK